MRKLVVLGTASDPELKRVKVYTPALPKRFHGNGSKVASAAVSPLKSDPPTHTRTTSYGTPTNHSDSLDDLTLPQLRNKVQQLKGEKTQVWGELNRCEGWYDSKGSMHARLKGIGEICAKLKEMTDVTLESVRKEEELKRKLDFGLNRAHKLLSQVTNSERPVSPHASTIPHPWYCYRISTIPAIISLSPNDGIATAFLCKTNEKLHVKTPFRKNMDPFSVLKCLFLRYDSQGLKLGFDERYREKEVKLAVRVEGLRGKMTVVGVKKGPEEVEMWVESMDLLPEILKMKVQIDRIPLTSPIFSDDIQLKHILQRHLIITESDNRPKLKWIASLWQLSRHIYKGKAPETNTGFNLTGMTTDERLRTYKEFDVLLGSGKVDISGNVLGVSLHYNEVLSLYRITVNKGDFRWVMKEEDHRKTFALLKGLQFTYLQDEHKTLFASLELRQVLISQLSPVLE